MEQVTVTVPLSTGSVPIVLAFLLLLITLLIFYLKPKSAVSDSKHLVISRSDSVPDACADKASVRILYGTQTGTAERLAKQLGNELRRKYGSSILVEVLDIENYKAEVRLPKEKLVLFLMATYGDGEPTDNAAEFYNWVVSEVDNVDNGAKDRFLEEVQFGVFGLGNKQYEHFNAVGKRVHQAMESLGAHAVCRRGDGDDDDSIEDDFDKWCTELLAALDRQPQLLGARADTETEQVMATYRVQVLSGIQGVSPFPNGSGQSAHDPYWATVTEVRELHTAGSERSCVHVEIDISHNRQLRYETGDHVGIHALNADNIVSEVAAALGWPLETVFILHTGGEGASGDLAGPFPGPILLSTALAYFADVLSCPHKDALLALASCATDEEEAARLRHLASPAGKASYVDYIATQHRSLLEVMQDFPSARPSLGLFFGSIAPRLAPRYYSISSGSLAHPHSVHVTCAIVRDVMPTGRIHNGVCSSYLQRCKPGDQIPVFIRHSTFKMPENPHAPLIMVGPGTGLAPFRGFIQDREALIADMAEVGPAVLFFGCRNRAHDYIYEAELTAAAESGALSQLHVAFSRAGPKKDYVQHHMEQQAEQLWSLLQQPGCCVYVCGDAKFMARDVHRTLISMVKSQGNMTDAQAETWVKHLSDFGRYHKDVW